MTVIITGASDDIIGADGDVRRVVHGIGHATTKDDR